MVEDSVKILITGPAGGGKSVLVRKIMSLYQTRQTIHGGVGGLPLAYVCNNGDGDSDRLQVLGNYETTFRDHHGLAQFNRYKADFLSVLKHAMKISYPVLCEGGFFHPKRLDCDIGREFSAACTIIWLDPPEARESTIQQRGRDLGDESYARQTDAASATMMKMVKLGASWMVKQDRDEALRTVCELISPVLNPARCVMPPQDKR